MAVAVAITAVDNGQFFEYVYGTLTVTGTYATGGDTLNFSGFDQIKSGQVPIQVYIQSQKGAGVSGFLYGFAAGTSLSNCKFQVVGQQPTSATAGVIALSELAAGAYPAGITGDVIVFNAIFQRV